MEKEFIPYKEALALKELGFDEPCFGYYGSFGANPSLLTIIGKEEHYNRKTYKAPLYQQAFRWFREKYNLHYHIATSNKGYVISVKGISIESFEWEKYKTYEEAELACLQKLIEIVK